MNSVIFAKSDEFSSKHQRSERTNQESSPAQRSSYSDPVQKPSTIASPLVTTGLRSRYNSRSHSKPPTTSILEYSSSRDPRLSIAKPSAYQQTTPGNPSAEGRSSLNGINDTPYTMPGLGPATDRRNRDISDEISLLPQQKAEQFTPFSNGSSLSHRNTASFVTPQTHIISTQPFTSNTSTGLVSSPSTSQTSTWVVALGVQPITATTASEGDSSGFSTNTANLNAVVTSLLLSLQDFGEIVEHRLGTGNWLFIRFANLYQADRAIRTGCLPISPHHAVSLLALTPTLAVSLGFDTTLANGSSTADSFHSQFSYSYNESLNTSPADCVGYRSIAPPRSIDEYLRPPKKSSSICSKIIEFFFAY